jgi:hypothetical protein
VSPEETAEILDLANQLQDLVITLVSDAMRSRDPLPAALAVQAKVDQLRHVARLACKTPSDPHT